MRTRIDWAAVQVYHDAGHTRGQCRSHFGFSLNSWTRAVRRGNLRPNRAFIRRYDWDEVQRYHDAGHERAACKARFGLCDHSWYAAINRGALIPRPKRYAKPSRPLEAILKNKNRYHVKQHLIKAGILVNRCEQCGISEWRGLPLTIQIDHRNGRKNDHRIENLRMLCPNCHSQTETYGARNRGRNSTPVSFLITEYSRVV